MPSPPGFSFSDSNDAFGNKNRKHSKQLWNQRRDIGQCVGLRLKDDDRAWQRRRILLIGDAVVFWLIQRQTLRPLHEQATLRFPFPPTPKNATVNTS
jgi:hypothetical protein